MTVASRVKQTVASLKSAEATIKNYALYHPDPNVKGVFENCHKNMKIMMDDMEKRLAQIEIEEPQFKGF